jgi:CDP-diacylglycerol--serine O-phosphatidyltransferase
MKKLKKVEPGADTVMRGIYILPNLITAASLFFGFRAIVAAFNGHFYDAAVYILISGFLDGIDGKIARLTGTSSRFGIEFDSMADLVAFGVAPGFLIYVWGLQPFGKFGWVAGFSYVICAALRLARFNIQVTTVEAKRFNGLASPAAAFVIATTVLLFHYFGATGTPKHITIVITTYILAFLMVSNVKYYSFKDPSLFKRQPFYVFVAVLILLTLIIAEHEIMLFILSVGYALSGPVEGLLFYGKRKEAKGEKQEVKSLN